VFTLRALLSRDGASEAEFDRIAEYLEGATDEGDLTLRIEKLKKHLVTRSDEAAATTDIKLGAPFSIISQRALPKTSHAFGCGFLLIC